jgi:hypothetical protein
MSGSSSAFSRLEGGRSPSTGGEPEPRDGSVISFAFGEETEHVVSELGAGFRTTQACTTELCSPRFPASGVACCPEERVEEDLYHLPTNWNPAASFCASGRTLTPAVGLSATIFDSYVNIPVTSRMSPPA